MRALDAQRRDGNSRVNALRSIWKLRLEAELDFPRWELESCGLSSPWETVLSHSCRWDDKRVSWKGVGCCRSSVSAHAAVVLGEGENRTGPLALS